MLIFAKEWLYSKLRMFQRPSHKFISLLTSKIKTVIAFFLKPSSTTAKDLYMIYPLIVLSSLICSFTDGYGTIATTKENLHARIQQSEADIVMVARNGKVIYQSPLPMDANIAIDSQELSHACIGLAYAFLIEGKLLPCLDVPVKFYFPDSTDWQTGWHASITIKHLLSQTSGLVRDLLFTSDDRTCPIASTCAPGTTFSDNGNNWRLLATLVEKISGSTLSEFLQEKLFNPLKIQHVSWGTSTENPPIHLFLSPADWMTIGEFMRSGGWISNKRYISESTMQLLLSPSQDFNPIYGQGWHLEFYNTSACWDDTLLDLYAKRDMDPLMIKSLATLSGREVHFTASPSATGPLNIQFAGMDPILGAPGFANCLAKVTHNLGVPLCTFRAGKLKSFSALGQGGQQLFIYPQGGIVALRQKRLCNTNTNDMLEDFPQILEKIATEYDGWVD